MRPPRPRSDGGRRPGWPFIPAIVLSAAAIALAGGFAPRVFAEGCAEVESKPVKIEVWMSKRFAKNLDSVGKGFAEIGNASVLLWVYPGDNPSRTIGVGRCVPAYIAQYVLREAGKYFGETDSLVNQGFLPPLWIGIGTSLFDENSLRRVGKEEMGTLIDSPQDTTAFQALYRKLSTQKKTVAVSGLDLPNPKFLIPE